LRATQASQAPRAFALDQCSQAFMHDSRTIQRTDKFRRLCQQSVIDVDRRSHWSCSGRMMMIEFTSLDAQFDAPPGSAAERKTPLGLEGRSSNGR
jgi:hypothetical protein